MVLNQTLLWMQLWELLLTLRKRMLTVLKGPTQAQGMSTGLLLMVGTERARMHTQPAPMAALWSIKKNII